MKSNYKLLGDYIREINARNTELKDLDLLGISIQKEFIPSIANTIGTDMSKYKIVKKNQFAYGTVTSRNGDKISIALLQNHEEALISQAYISFEVIDENKLLPEYLMMWFRRPEFDRYARYMSYGSAREVFSWEEMCNVKLPIPSIEKQREIVKEYNAIIDRIKLNENMIGKLEELAQSIYKQWFIDFNYEDENVRAYKEEGGTVYFNSELDKEIPTEWDVIKIKDFGTVITGKTPSSKNPEDFGEKMPFVTPGDFKNYNKFVLGAERNLSDLGINRLKSKVLRNRSVIVTCIGSDMGKVVLSQGECITNQQMNSIIVNKDYYSDYLYYNLKLRSSELKSIALGGSTMPMLNKSEFESINILKPDDNILDKFSDILNPINQEIIVKSRMIKLLYDMKYIMLSRISNMGE